jgi:nuclear receptor subfamily 5 group A member 3
MRGGRNKFGPMYKRDRARKLQILRQRQLALQAIRGSIGGGSSSSGTAADGGQSQLSPTGYPSYSNMHIKQEIQIPQVNDIAREVNDIFTIFSLFTGLITYFVA